VAVGAGIALRFLPRHAAGHVHIAERVLVDELEVAPAS
jgi:hypothetical protein